MDTTTINLSVTEIEQQIAKVQTALDKARTQQLLKAEKALAATQKAVVLAQNKVDALLAKPALTTVAKTRLATANTTLTHHTEARAQAENELDELLTERKDASKIAKKTLKILKKSAKGKRSKAERKLDKKAKKIAKKIAAHEEAKALLETQADRTPIVVTATKKAEPVVTKPKTVRKASAKPRAGAPSAIAPASISSSAQHPSTQETNVEAVVETNDVAIAPEEKRVSVEG